MDPISITGTCVGLLASIVKLSVRITQFVGEVRDSRKDMDAVRRELSSLSFCVESLRDDTAEHDTLYPVSLQSNLISVLDNSSEVMVEITTLLEKSSVGGLGRRMLWAVSTQQEVNKLRARLEAHKATLEIALDMASICLIKTVKDDTTAIISDTQAIKQDTIHVPSIKEDTSQLLAKISNLEARLSQMQQLPQGKADILQRFLDSSTIYAESVIQPFDPEDSDMEAPTISRKESDLQLAQKYQTTDVGEHERPSGAVPQASTLKSSPPMATIKTSQSNREEQREYQQREDLENIGSRHPKTSAFEEHLQSPTPNPTADLWQDSHERSPSIEESNQHHHESEADDVGKDFPTASDGSYRQTSTERVTPLDGEDSPGTPRILDEHSEDLDEGSEPPPRRTFEISGSRSRGHVRTFHRSTIHQKLNKFNNPSEVRSEPRMTEMEDQNTKFPDISYADTVAARDDDGGADESKQNQMKRGIVSFNFSAKEANQLSVTKGDAVHVIGHVEVGDWFFVKLIKDGGFGWVPSPYISVKPSSIGDSDTDQVHHNDSDIDWTSALRSLSESLFYAATPDFEVKAFIAKLGFLISKGADVDDDDGNLLYLAARRFRWDIIQYVMPLCRPESCFRALKQLLSIHHCKYGHRDEDDADIEHDLIIASKPALEQSPVCRSVILTAIRNHHWWAIPLLIVEGVSSDLDKALHLAVASTPEEFMMEPIECLVEHGANVNYELRHEYPYSTVLERAAISGRPEVVSYLLDQGADVLQVGPLGRTALQEVKKCEPKAKSPEKEKSQEVIAILKSAEKQARKSQSLRKKWFQ